MRVNSKQSLIFMSHFEERGKRPAGQALQTFVLILSLLSATESVAVLFSSTLSILNISSNSFIGGKQTRWKFVVIYFGFPPKTNMENAGRRS